MEFSPHTPIRMGLLRDAPWFYEISNFTDLKIGNKSCNIRGILRNPSERSLEFLKRANLIRFQMLKLDRKLDMIRSRCSDLVTLASSEDEKMKQ